MAITFGALSEDTEALKDTISSGPPTLDEGTADLRAQRPFLVDFADLNNRLEPGVVALRQALPVLNSALTVGAPVLKDTPPVNVKLRGVFTQLRSLVRQPQTKTTLLRLRETFNQAAPAATHIAPYQTVCNYWNYWFTYLPEHLTEEDSIGTTQRVSIVAVPGTTSPPGERPEAPTGGYSGIAGQRQDPRQPGPKPRQPGRVHAPQAADPARARLRAGDRRCRQRRLPGRPGRLPAR